MRVDPLLKIEKNFFAFLDELDHSTHFKNCLEIDLGLTPSPPTGLEISEQFLVFLLCMVPLVINYKISMKEKREILVMTFNVYLKRENQSQVCK